MFAQKNAPWPSLRVGWVEGKQLSLIYTRQMVIITPVLGVWGERSPQSKGRIEYDSGQLKKKKSAEHEGALPVAEMVESIHPFLVHSLVPWTTGAGNLLSARTLESCCTFRSQGSQKQPCPLRVYTLLATENQVSGDPIRSRRQETWCWSNGSHPTALSPPPALGSPHFRHWWPRKALTFM